MLQVLTSWILDGRRAFRSSTAQCGGARDSHGSPPPTQAWSEVHADVHPLMCSAPEPH